MAQKQWLKLPFVLNVLLIGLVFRAIIAYWLPLGFDEGYYYLYTQHLDWSYFDHPLMVALTTGFGPWLTQFTHPFSLRLGAVLLYSLSLWFLYQTNYKLFNPRAAQITLVLASIIPIFQVGFGVLTLPDSPLIFFWSVALYWGVEEFFSDQKPYRPSYRLVVLGIILGLACLSKYHGFLLGFAFLGFSLSSPRHRSALSSPFFALTCLLFLLTLFPLLFWNSQHDWISFKFQLFQRFSPGAESTPSSYSFLQVLAVWGTGIGLLFPSLGIPLWWALGKGFWCQLSNLIRSPATPMMPGEDLLQEKQAFILWSAIPLTLGLTLLGGKEQILVTWPMPGFWSAVLLLGLYASRWEQLSRQSVKRWLVGSTLVIASLLLLVLLHINNGMLLKSSTSALGGGFLGATADPANELIDIRQLRQGVRNSALLTEALTQADFIFTNAYYLGGLIDLALRPLHAIPVTCFSYDQRGFSFWPNSTQWRGKNALYITLRRFREMPELTEEFSSFFQSFRELGKVDIKRGGIVVESFYFYQASNLLKPYHPSLDSVQ